MPTPDPDAAAALRSERPAPDEHAPYQAAYIAHVPRGDVLEALRGQLDEVLALAAQVPRERESFRYAPGKWSVVEVLGHVTDMERVFGQRALGFARRDPGPFPGVDEDPYVAAADFGARGLASVLREFEHLRRANLELFAHLDADALRRRGRASGYELSVRGLLYLVAGHAAHHVGVLRARYGEALGA